jgi:hypothetical protein
VEVVDARRRGDGRLWTQYTGVADAQLGYFVRYTPICIEDANDSPAFAELDLKTLGSADAMVPTLGALVNRAGWLGAKKARRRKQKGAALTAPPFSYVP